MIQVAPPAVVQPATPPAQAANASQDPATHAAASPAAAAGLGPGVTPRVNPAASVESYPASFFAAALPANANDMIARLPGFSFDAGGGVRGFGGAGGNVLIDGRRPASKNDDIASALTRIPAAQVLRIDIIRGGAPGIDMGGKAVVANVIRKAGASSNLTAVLTQQLVTSDGRYIPALRLEGSHTDADGRSWGGSLLTGREFDDSVGSGTRTEATGDGRPLGIARDVSVGTGAFANLAANHSRPALGGTLRLNASANWEGFVSTERVDAIAGVAAASDERDVQHSITGEVGANLTRPLGPRWSSETVLIQQVANQNYRAAILSGSPPDAALFRQSHLQTESIVRETLTWTRSPRWTVQAGAEGDYNRLSSRSAYSDNGIVQDLPAANVVVDEWRGEAFVKAIVTPTKRWSIEAGARQEVSRIGSTGDVVLTRTLSYFKPRLLVTRSLAGEDQLRVRLEREVNQLDFDDFVASSSFSTGQVRAGNPDLVPQHSDVAEAAFEKHFARTGAAVLTYRHSWLHDVLDRAPVYGDGTVFDAPANIGRGHRDDVVATLTLPLAPFGLKDGLIRAEGNWRRSSVVDPTTGVTRAISSLYPFDGSATVSEDLPRRHLSLSATLRSGRIRTFYYYNQIEAYRVLPSGSMQVSWHPSKPWTLQAMVYDIGQRRERRVTAWADTRADAPPASRETRRLAIGPTLSLRIRRDW